MEAIEELIPLIPGLLEKGLAERAWDDAMVLLREAVPLLKVADKTQLLTSLLALLGEGSNAMKTLDALCDLGKVLIILGMDPNQRQAVLNFVSSMVIKAGAKAEAPRFVTGG